MLTKRDIITSLIISSGSFVVAMGVIGVKNIIISMLFFIIPLLVTLVLFWIFKPKTSNTFSDKKWEY